MLHALIECKDEHHRASENLQHDAAEIKETHMADTDSPADDSSDDAEVEGFIWGPEDKFGLYTKLEPKIGGLRPQDTFGGQGGSWSAWSTTDLTTENNK